MKNQDYTTIREAWAKVDPEDPFTLVKFLRKYPDARVENDYQFFYLNIDNREVDGSNMYERSAQTGILDLAQRLAEVQNALSIAVPLIEFDYGNSRSDITEFIKEAKYLNKL
jgi:hypothetical protein